MTWRPFTVLALAALGCAAWRTLDALESEVVLAASPTANPLADWKVHLVPSQAVVEAWLGPFQNEVQVQLMEGPMQISGDEREVLSPGGAPLSGVERELFKIRGYHLSHGRHSGKSSIFVHDPRPGTLVHEMVHARMAEEVEDLPLWFTEGIACLLSDGILYEQQWVRDGFLAWPWTELRNHRPSGIELREILNLNSESASSAESILLAHFVGWALVFDLWRETRSDDWRRWQSAFDWDHPLQDAERRLARVLMTSIPTSWMRSRLASPHSGVRLAALRGSWKLGHAGVGAVLMGALELEPDHEVRVALAVNLLASNDEVGSTRAAILKIHKTARSALLRSSLPSPDEARAVQELVLALQDETRDTAQPIEGLRRFWDE